jgi:cytochrome c
MGQYSALGPCYSLAMRIVLSLFLLVHISSVSRADDIAAGKKLVEANCSRCHAIGVTGDSPLAKAPPFREVVTRYPPESLGEALVEGIMTGHNEMPEFVFEPDQASEIIAYLDSLKVK